MTNADSGIAPSSTPSPAQGDRWLTALASLLVGGAFFSLWFWLLPQWLGFRVETAGAARWRWLAALPSVLGFAVALRCIWDFGWTGRGTPAPNCSPSALGRGRLLPLRAESDVPGFRRGMDRSMDRLRPRESGSHCRRGRCRTGHTSVCDVLRRADPAREVRGGLRRVLSKRAAMVAESAGLGEGVGVDGLAGFGESQSQRPRAWAPAPHGCCRHMHCTAHALLKSKSPP